MEITTSTGRDSGRFPAEKSLAVGLFAFVAILFSAVPGLAQEEIDAEPYVAPVDVDTLGLPGPRQPIFYRHDIHAGQYEMDCRYCHFAAEVSIEPGIPTMTTCLGCHQIIATTSPEVQKIQAAVLEEVPPEWIRIHNLPGHVRFPHQVHVNSTEPEVTCQECHGPIERMVQVYQWASLKMGWCLDCHIENDVTTDCTACHY